MVVNAGSGLFWAEGVLPPHWISIHVNGKEMYTLYQVLRRFGTQLPDVLRRAQVFVDVDNKSVARAFNRGGRRTWNTRVVCATLRFASGAWVHVGIEVNSDGSEQHRRRYLATLASVQYSAAPRGFPERV